MIGRRWQGVGDKSRGDNADSGGEAVIITVVGVVVVGEEGVVAVTVT